jgi:hypothetical protein
LRSFPSRVEFDVMGCVDMLTGTALAKDRQTMRRIRLVSIRLTRLELRRPSKAQKMIDVVDSDGQQVPNYARLAQHRFYL